MAYAVAEVSKPSVSALASVEQAGPVFGGLSNHYLAVFGIMAVSVILALRKRAKVNPSGARR